MSSGQYTENDESGAVTDTRPPLRVQSQQFLRFTWNNRLNPFDAEGRNLGERAETSTFETVQRCDGYPGNFKNILKILCPNDVNSLFA
jgi:hypothetical protein